MRERSLRCCREAVCVGASVNEQKSLMEIYGTCAADMNLPLCVVGARSGTWESCRSVLANECWTEQWKRTLISHSLCFEQRKGFFFCWVFLQRCSHCSPQHWSALQVLNMTEYKIILTRIRVWTCLIPGKLGRFGSSASVVTWVRAPAWCLQNRCSELMDLLWSCLPGCQGTCTSTHSQELLMPYGLFSCWSLSLTVQQTEAIALCSLSHEKGRVRTVEKLSEGSD